MFRASATASTLGKRRRLLGGRTTSVGTPSTVLESVGSSSSEDEGGRSGATFRLSPSRGIPYTTALTSIGLLPSPATFLKRLARFMTVFPAHEEFRSTRAREKFLDQHTTRLDVNRLKFYRSLVSKISSEYAFSVVACNSYRGSKRHDCISIRSDDPRKPFYAQALAWFTYEVGAELKRLCYVKYFTRAVRTPTAVAGYRLPFTRLGVEGYDFIEIESVIQPANIIPNMDTRIAKQTASLPMADRFTHFYLCEQHFPNAL